MSLKDEYLFMNNLSLECFLREKFKKHNKLIIIFFYISYTTQIKVFTDQLAKRWSFVNQLFKRKMYISVSTCLLNIESKFEGNYNLVILIFCIYHTQ